MASAVKTFDMQSKDVSSRNSEAVSCLNAWSKCLSDTGLGTMMVKEGAKSVSINLQSDKGDSIEAVLSGLLVHHTYKHFCERSMGCSEMSKHYDVTVQGKDQQGQSVEFRLYVNRTCEDGRNWSSTLGVTKMKATQEPAEGKE